MDEKTLNYYCDNAVELAERYGSAKSGIAQYFQQAFSGRQRIIDVGCGTGRDLNLLLEMGFEAEGIDPCQELLDQAAIKYPKTSGKVRVDVLPALKTVKKGHFDGILCSSVLMHLPEELLFDSIYALRAILRPAGHLLMSVPLHDDTIDKNHRDANQRLFNGVTPEKFHLLFERVGFKLLNRWDNEDSLGRTHRRWATMLFELESQDGTRSLDKIEAILNRDKKSATYKLALFRALAELAMTNYNAAVWLPGGVVSMPIDYVIEKWMEYYWPIVESDLFIPQNNGEKPNCKKPIAIRAPLNDLVSCYEGKGGQPAFTVQYRSNSIPREAAAALKRVTQMIRTTLIDGPIKHSGGEGSNTFCYDTALKCILIPADMWRELALMGNWIIDATILRWAELTARISKEEIKPSQVIDLLLTVPIPEREVGAARLVYDAMDSKVCVWSDKTIRKNKYDVDHAIPFTLWHNNDIWNLLPANSVENNRKRDKLPSRDLVYARKDCIIHYWEQMKGAYEHRFSFETAKFVGKSLGNTENWQNSLFSAFSEAVEVTAIQRGAERWQPGTFDVSAVHFAENDQISSENGPEKAKKSQKLAKNDENTQKTPDFIDFPPENDQFVTCVPFYDIEAAAGPFGEEQSYVDEISNHETWLRVETGKLTPDMFAIRISGHSMEPKIPDGSIAIFQAGNALAGSRKGKIVLVQLLDQHDPDTNSRFTVKKYSSEKKYDEDGHFEHQNITLSPLNPDFTPILIEKSDPDTTFRVLGVFVEIIQGR